MSRVADLLARKRAAEIKRMETGAEVPTDDVDAALRSVKPPETPKSANPRSTRLTRWRGCAIIVRPGDGERPPALVTVLADGGDTVFLGKRG